MKLKLNTEELKETMISFYTLTGIRIVIFDTEYQEILAYPEEKCPFCKTIRSVPQLEQRCFQSDYKAFQQCAEKEEIIIYNCHAGLVEAVAPLKSGARLIGYMMFGQITDMKNKKDLDRLATEIGNKHDISCNITGIKFKSKKQILATAKLLEICTDYILIKEMVDAESNQIISRAKEYIKTHLAEDIKIAELTAYCNVGRTKLYEMFNKEFCMGISAYINDKKLEHARKLLKTTDLSVAEVSDAIGFLDYNYFSRVYKKKFGISPHKTK